METRVIEVVEYQQQWLEMFIKERELLCCNLGRNVIEAHHIGSTAVVGLASKPIIDIILLVRSLVDLDKQINDLVALGYLAKGENGIVGRRFFIKGGVQRSHHLHAYEQGHADISRHFVFRDYLRNNSDVALQYAQVKTDAAAKCNNNATLYCQLKNDFLVHHQALALCTTEH